MAVVFSNNAASTLQSGINSSATSITLLSGANFPSLSGSDYTYVTLEDVNGHREIVKATARSGNTLTIVRAQDGTSARAYIAGDKCELRLTAALLNEVAQQADTDTNTTYTAGTGLSLTGTQFANTAPDQTVSLTGAGAATITGTYPNFTITTTDTNTTYSIQDGQLSQNNFTNADHTKLNAIEANATADQTDAEIKTAYENNTDTNEFSDAEKTKLAGIEANATADQTDAEIRAAVEAATDSNVFTDADHTKLNSLETGATADQTDAEIRAAVEAATDSNVFTDADHTKLNSLETGATADQTDAEIRAAVEAATDSNVFTDADHTKLNGIANNANNYVLPFTDNSSNWNVAFGWGNHGAAGYLTSHQSLSGLASESYVNTQVSNLVDSAPGTLNTLNELAAALGDNANFSTTVTNSLASKLPLAGGTLTGDLTVNSTGFIKLPVGTTAQRSSSPAKGMIRFNSTTGKLEQYSTAWSDVGSAADFRLNTFTGNGSTTAYTLTTNPVEDNTLVYIDGVYQNKSSYSIVNNILTFSAAPPNGTAIEITAATAAPVEASTEFKLSQFSGNGSATTFTLSAQTPENNTNVYIDGVYQSKSNYSVSGTTLTFTTAPPAGTSIEVMAAHAVVVSVSVPDDGSVTNAKLDSVLAQRIVDLEDEILLNLGV